MKRKASVLLGIGKFNPRATERNSTHGYPERADSAQTRLVVPVDCRDKFKQETSEECSKTIELFITSFGICANYQAVRNDTQEDDQDGVKDEEEDGDEPHEEEDGDEPHEEEDGDNTGEPGHTGF